MTRPLDGGRPGGGGGDVTEILAANSSIIVTDGGGPVVTLSTESVPLGRATNAAPADTTALPTSPDPFVSMDLGSVPAGWLKLTISTFATADANNTDASFAAFINGVPPFPATVISIKSAGDFEPSSGTILSLWAGGPFEFSTSISRDSGQGTVTFLTMYLEVESIPTPIIS